MKNWLTEIKAISPKDGEIKLYGGPNIKANTFEEAEKYCQDNGLGYCSVKGLLVMEIGCINGTHKPDWNNVIVYDDKFANFN